MMQGRYQEMAYSSSSESVRESLLGYIAASDSYLLPGNSLRSWQYIVLCLHHRHYFKQQLFRLSLQVTKDTEDSSLHVKDIFFLPNPSVFYLQVYPSVISTSYAVISS